MISVKRDKSEYRLRQTAIGLVLLLVLGCRSEEDITKTTEPRDRFAKPVAIKPDAPKSEKIPTRILGVIAPGVEGGSWFFKLIGPADAVAKEQAAFDEFLSSIKFTDAMDKPVTWTLPAGWKEGAKKGRYATLLLGGADDPLELPVTHFGGSLLENVNRWRVQQLGLEPVTQDSLDSCCREVTTKQGKKVMRVDLTGMAGKGPAMPPFMQGR